jgi:hypothetical protein
MVMEIKRVSVITGIERELDIPVSEKAWNDWKLGLGSINDCMPDLSDADREFILSGITPEEWTEAFKEALEVV